MTIDADQTERDLLALGDDPEFRDEPVADPGGDTGSTSNPDTTDREVNPMSTPDTTGGTPPPAAPSAATTPPAAPPASAPPSAPDDRLARLEAVVGRLADVVGASIAATPATPPAAESAEEFLARQRARISSSVALRNNAALEEAQAAYEVAEIEAREAAIAHYMDNGRFPDGGAVGAVGASPIEALQRLLLDPSAKEFIENLIDAKLARPLYDLQELQADVEHAQTFLAEEVNVGRFSKGSRYKRRSRPEPPAAPAPPDIEADASEEPTVFLPPASPPAA